MAPARPVGSGFSPLDEELGLLSGNLTPRLQEALVRLSTYIPSFAKATRELAWFTGAQVHPDTARRRTEAAGAVLVAHETRAAERIQRDYPPPPCTPDKLLFSVDGAMIPLVHGQWAEVRTLAVGEVVPANVTRDGPVVQTTNLSYFSRCTSSTLFGELALLELHRRGIDGANQVGAVVDGALWGQTFIDLHYPEAVRILDFPHASEYLTTIAHTTGNDGPLLSADEHAALRHALKHAGPDAVLPRLREVVASQGEHAPLRTALAYLEARVAQMQYPRFQADGWPIGSGIVESANKLVVEDRLKGAGMHWADANVNPLLALRNAVCNDRWDECWQLIAEGLRADVEQRRHGRRPPQTTATQPQQPSAPPATPRTISLPAPEPPAQPVEPKAPAVHPWRRPWSIRRQRELANAA
jgi:hypothetical protein